MSYRLLTLNAAATALISPAVAAAGETPMVRMRANDDGSIDIRPTVRARTINLPKGEVLRPIGTKGSGRTVGIPAEALPNVGTGQVQLEAGKYGWFSLRSVEELARGAAGGRISTK